MKHSKVFFVLASLSIVLTVACGQKKDDSPANVSGAGAINIEAGAPGFPQMAYNRQMSNIMPTDQNQLNTAARALALANPTLTPNDVGNITGVTIQGDVAIDLNNGNVIIGNQTDSFSNIQVLISDSWVGQQGQNGTIQPISVFVRARSGRAAKGNVSLVFGDNLGTIVVNGSYNASSFQGTVSFQNTNGSTGTLGRFNVNTCSFFRCM